MFKLKVSTALLLFIWLTADGGPLQAQKIKGVHLESPVEPRSENYLKPLQRLNANWVALVPYVFIDAKTGGISYPHPQNWWGDAGAGLYRSIALAKAENLKICLKPHFWLAQEKRWAGELDLSEKEWQRWEKEYRQLLLSFARLADSLAIEMLCVGTELKSAVVERPLFWQNLISEIRQIYQGQLIYAANWDNYQAVPFWAQLDLIGVNAYFPLRQQKTPNPEALAYSWNIENYALARFAQAQQKQIIFTEMGYRSTNFCAWRHWEIEDQADKVNVNLAAQNIALEALFKACWNQNWWAGGFIWEWHAADETAGGPAHSNYSPQHKPVEKTIATWYLKE